MLVNVKLFAGARDLAGCGHLEIELSNGATVADLRRAIALRMPALAPLLPHTQVALDAHYAKDNESIAPQAEVALIPPVSGG